MGLAPAQKKPEHAPATAPAQEPVVQKAACASCNTPGTPLYVQKSSAPRSTMQKGAGADLGGPAVVKLASSGVATAAAPLPHLERIQQSFGSHDVSHVKTATGGDAGEAASQMGARAYAVGDRIGFREEPDVRLAAHEAAHTVQQRGGVQLKDGVGRPGDHYEKQADAAADAVVEGRSAEAILGPAAPSRGGGGGVQMACSCGGTCGSCASSQPQVQFELEANVEREVVPALGGPAHQEAPAGGGEGATEAAKEGAGTEGGKDAAGGGGAKEGGDSKAQAADAPTPQDVAMEKSMQAAGAKACPPEPDPPAAEKQEAGEDEGGCTDYGTWDKADPPVPTEGEGEQKKAKEPPDPPMAEIRTQASSKGEKVADAKPETSSKQAEKPKSPEGCEEKKESSDKSGDAGGGEAEAGGGGGGGEEQAADPMEGMIAEAVEHREGGRSAYRDGAAQVVAAKARVRHASADPVKFAKADSASEGAASASAVASRSFLEMGGEATTLLDEIVANTPVHVGDTFFGVRDGIIAARERSLADIETSFSIAKGSAVARASQAKSTVRSQYLQTVISQTASAALAIVGVINATTKTITAIGAAQTAQMTALTQTFNDGKKALIDAGTKQGNAAIAIGKRYHGFYTNGVPKKRDSIMKGYLTWRRAQARGKAAMDTAKGMRDSFAQEAHGQAREFGKTKSGHCATVFKTAAGAQSGVTDGAGKAIKGVYQLLGQSIQQAGAERDSRTQSIETQLSGQLAQLSQQEAKQKQTARDTAWLQILAAQLTAQQMTGDLFGAAAQAVRGVGDGIAEARTQLEAGAPSSIESTHVMMRMIRARVTGSLKIIRERLDGGVARTVANVDGHHQKAYGHIGKHVDSARDAAQQMAASFGQAMTAAIGDAIKSFEGQRTQFSGHMTKLETGIVHAFGCAVKSVQQAYTQQNESITSGNKDHASKLDKNFSDQIKGGKGSDSRFDGLTASIKYYACLAARRERPAWEEIAKIILIIVVAIIVSALLGPVVGALVAGVGLAGAAATIVTAIIVGAIAGAVSSVAGQLFDNAMSGRRLGYGVKAAAKSGAISGAIGGFFGGVGAVFVKAAGAAGAGVLAKFAISFTADMAAEYATQVATNLMEGKSLGDSLTKINASGFIMAGTMSAGMFALHNVKLPGSKKAPPEVRPGLNQKIGPGKIARAGEIIKAAETKITQSKPARAIGRAAGAVTNALETAMHRLGPVGKVAKSLLNLLGKFQDLNTTFGEKTTKLGEGLAKRLGIKLDVHTNAPKSDDATATPKETTAAPHDGPSVPKETGPLPHEATAAPKDAPSVSKPTEADFKTVEATGNKSHDQLTPGERLAEQRVGEHGEKLPVKEPFVEGGKLPNEHPWGNTADGKFCRYTKGSCSTGGKKVDPPANMPEGTPLKDAPEVKPTTDAPDAKPIAEPDTINAPKEKKRLPVGTDAEIKALKDDPPRAPEGTDPKLAGEYNAYVEKKVRQAAKRLAKGKPGGEGPLEFADYQKSLRDFAFGGVGKKFQADRAAHVEAQAKATDPSARVDVDLGLKKGRVPGGLRPGKSRTKFADVAVHDANGLRVESHKQRDLTARKGPGGLASAKKQVRADVGEAIRKYGGTVEVRREGHPLFGADKKAVIKNVTLIYDGSLVPPQMRPELIKEASLASSASSKSVKVTLVFWP